MIANPEINLMACRSRSQVLTVKSNLVNFFRKMKDFWENVSRYPRFFITISLGIFYFLFERLKPLFERPLTAIALTGVLVAGFFFIAFTLRAMLGLNPV